jgi:hypothetical protein
MNLDTFSVVVVALVGLGFVAIVVMELVLDRWWQRLWKRPEPKKHRDPWSDRTGI